MDLFAPLTLSPTAWILAALLALIFAALWSIARAVDRIARYLDLLAQAPTPIPPPTLPDTLASPQIWVQDTWGRHERNR